VDRASRRSQRRSPENTTGTGEGAAAHQSFVYTAELNGPDRYEGPPTPAEACRLPSGDPARNVICEREQFFNGRVERPRERNATAVFGT